MAQLKALTVETEDQRSQITQMEKEVSSLQTELAAQKEANVRSPSNTMKNLVERLKAQLAQREKQLKVVLQLSGAKTTCFLLFGNDAMTVLSPSVSVSSQRDRLVHLFSLMSVQSILLHFSPLVTDKTLDLNIN